MCWWVNKYLNTHTHMHTTDTLNGLCVCECVFLYLPLFPCQHLQCCKTLRPRNGQDHKRVVACCKLVAHLNGTFAGCHITNVAAGRRGRAAVLWPNEFYTSKIHNLARFVIRCGQRVHSECWSWAHKHTHKKKNKSTFSAEHLSISLQLDYSAWIYISIQRQLKSA